MDELADIGGGSDLWHHHVVHTDLKDLLYTYGKWYKVRDEQRFLDSGW